MLIATTARKYWRPFPGRSQQLCGASAHVPSEYWVTTREVARCVMRAIAGLVRNSNILHEHSLQCDCLSPARRQAGCGDFFGLYERY